MLKSELINYLLETGEPQLSEEDLDIVSTCDLAAHPDKTRLYQLQAKDVRPMSWSRILILFSLLTSLTGFLLLANQLVQSTVPRLTLGVIFTALLLLFIFPFYILLKGGNGAHNLRISPQGITATNYFLSWKQLSESWIIYITKGRFNRVYLVLISRDNFFIKVNLREFLISNKRVAMLIEAHKMAG